jgi:glycosyltransferase 2 family protein
LGSRLHPDGPEDMTRRSALTWIGATISSLALGFVVWRLADQIDRIPQVRWNVTTVSSFAAVILLSGVPALMAAAGMPLLLRAARVSLSWRDSFVLVGRSQIGKYLPGNVFHYVGRIGLGIRRGLPVGPLSLAVGIETAFTIVIALGIGATGSLLEGTFTDSHSQTPRFAVFWITTGLGTIALLAVSLTPARHVVADFVRQRRSYYSPRRAFALATLYTFAFASLGVAIELIVRGVMGIQSPWGWLQFAWRFALIWVLGLIAIGAPAGLGVREASLLVWFSPVLGESAALGLAGLLRLGTIAADLIVFALASMLDFSRNRTAAGVQTTTSSNNASPS